jgi:transposase
MMLLLLLLHCICMCALTCAHVTISYSLHGGCQVVGVEWLHRTAGLLDDEKKAQEFRDLSALLSEQQRQWFDGLKDSVEYEKEALRLRKHIRNRKLSMQRTVVAHLLREFDVLLWPELDVAELTRREDRSFGRAMTTLLLRGIGHGEMRRYAVQQAASYVGKRVVDATEAFSTISCSRCGHCRTSFAGEQFHCTNPECQHTDERDCNAAINIAIFNFQDVLKPVPVCMWTRYQPP